MINRILLTLPLLIVFAVSSSGQTISPQQLLERSIKYHDPKVKWGKQPLKLQLRETRPGNPDRMTDLEIDLRHSSFTLDQLRDGNRLGYKVSGNDCSFTLNGSSTISEAEREKFRLNCERARTMRDYYTYLWGLPMKLTDAGTILQEVTMDQFMEKKAYKLKVTYSPEVGGDTWYFYFDPTTYALIGYRFYHDEAANDGEYIVLEGEEKVGNFRLPKERRWYTHQDDEFLGADMIW